ncbi:hypothetical protein HOG48_01565 [Candidatus Peregrinibacteria bacterium]|jgi:hypothetical protein|nr:hypothetical protein [Candidatus Peregrinibacteria bacterium]
MRVERFPGQKEGEKVRLIVSKHWIIYVHMLKQFVIFAIVPFFTVIFLTADTDPNVKSIFYIFALVYLSYFFLIVFIKWLDELLDIIIVTNKRIISIEQVNLFQNTSSETNLPMIQDVKSRKKGILGSLFHFGELEIQTAAEKIAFRITDVAQPFTQAKAILDARDEFIRESKGHHHRTDDPTSGLRYHGAAERAQPVAPASAPGPIPPTQSVAPAPTSPSIAPTPVSTQPVAPIPPAQPVPSAIFPAPAAPPIPSIESEPPNINSLNL